MIRHDICMLRNRLGSSEDKLFIITNKKIENKNNNKREKKKRRRRRTRKRKEKVLRFFDFS